jgi:hypothetical protein
MRRLLGMIVLAAACGSAGLASQAAADPALVYTFAQGTSTCSIAAFGGDYSGIASTTVLKDGNLVLTQCHATLVSGTQVSSTRVVRSGGCTEVIAPDGGANLTCTKR